jgi:hypothetical protein
MLLIEMALRFRFVIEDLICYTEVNDYDVNHTFYAKHTFYKSRAVKYEIKGLPLISN